MADDLKASDAKLIQYLNEAYGKEKELETSLNAHIAMTTRAPYKKRLQEHLRETKRHSKEVERRIKKLGGKAEAAPVPDAVPDAVGEAVTGVTNLASRAVAAAKGPVHMIRGTGEQEKMLKNARTEYQNEADEIAQYTAIETLANEVGDKETARLAKSIRREEERMAKFLSGLIPQLTKAVAKEEIPAAERGSRGAAARRGSSSGSGSSSSSRSSSSGSRSSSSRSKSSASGRKSSSSRSSATRSKSSASGRKSTASRAKSGSSRSSASSSRSRGSSKRSSSK